jgi:lysophospholipase L1-like esterase
MASTGDSITRAFDVGWCCALHDNPRFSWSTGNNPQVLSQYLRILEGNPAIEGHAYNDALSGAQMDDLARQLRRAGGQNVEYVTVLIGANDLCTSTIDSMTTVETFRSEFHNALAQFGSLDPNAHVFVSSIPDVYQLWKVLHTNLLARETWASFDICQSLLSTSNTEADRQMVVQREGSFNQVLLDECASYANCLWDGYATYNFKFPASDVSKVDYFHPNFAGQNALAATTWAAGYWPGTNAKAP